MIKRTYLYIFFMFLASTTILSADADADAPGPRDFLPRTSASAKLSQGGTAHKRARKSRQALERYPCTKGIPRICPVSETPSPP
jgi:hypothetical protein